MNTPTPVPRGTPVIDTSMLHIETVAENAVGIWNLGVAPYWEMLAWLVLVSMVLGTLALIIRMWKSSKETG